MFTNLLNISFPVGTWVEKLDVEIHRLSSKEKVPGAAFGKKDPVKTLLDYERILVKGATVNSTSYC